MAPAVVVAGRSNIGASKLESRETCTRASASLPTQRRLTGLGVPWKYIFAMADGATRRTAHPDLIFHAPLSTSAVALTGTCRPSCRRAEP
jgi:hypothetical protein